MWSAPSAAKESRTLLRRNFTRHRAAEELRDSSKKLDAELRDRKERLLRTEEKMAGLVDFIANGERVQYIVQTLRDRASPRSNTRSEISIGGSIDSGCIGG